MARYDVYGGAVQVQQLSEINVYDDFELDDLEQEEITIHDVDNVLGYTVDVLKVGFPFMFLVAFLIGLVYMFGMYL